MKIWILNLVGISMFGILIEILMPKGSSNKYIKGVISLVIIYVIISPMVSIFSSYKFGNVKDFILGDFAVDYDFIQDVNYQKNEIAESNLKQILNDKGYKNVEVNIVFNQNGQNSIQFVKISLKNLVIDSNVPNIDIQEQISKIVSEKLKIDKNRIYYE